MLIKDIFTVSVTVYRICVIDASYTASPGSPDADAILSLSWKSGKKFRSFFLEFKRHNKKF